MSFSRPLLTAAALLHASMNRETNSRRILLSLAVFAAAAALTLRDFDAPATQAATPSVLADTPPMGWNSWDCFGATVREDEVKANADYMAKHLARFGWQYVVVDIQWYEPEARGYDYRPGAELTMDRYGRLLPAVNRFPSAAAGAGFKPLADYVHKLGLKFGIHIMRGIPRGAVRDNTPILGSTARARDIADPYSLCPWNPDMYGINMSRRGAQEYYNSIVQLYADWGVDFIKADDEIRPIHRDEIRALHVAIQKTRRPVVLSLSPGPARVEDADFLAENAQMWRVSDDFWDDWRLLRQNFILLSIWGGFGRPGAWPDGDMLPLGHIGGRSAEGRGRWTRFTKTEQRTLVTLWSIARSPLIMGGNLPENDEFTDSLLTNEEVIAVNQRGVNAREFFLSGPRIVWISDQHGAPGKNVAVFNVGDHSTAKIPIQWRAIGLPDVCAVRDLWTGETLGEFRDSYTFELEPHASGLYRITPAP
jgi:alpha-galactosidase